MSKTFSFHTLDVFTDQIFGGNPLAVCPDAEGLSTQQMQAIAQELNLSETVFVLPTEKSDCDFKLRIFTPRAEIPFAGHPTVGTAYLLAHLGLVNASSHSVVNLEEQVGKVPVAIDWAGETVQKTALQAAQLPEFSAVPDGLELPQLLGLSNSDIHSDMPVEVISCGLPFLYISLSNQAAVDACVLNSTVWQNTLADTNAAHVYVFAITETGSIYSRMFAPGLGIAEDPATGSAATSLAGYLHRHCHQDVETDTKTWRIDQGIKMGRPSQLQLAIAIKDKKITDIQVGGQSVLVSKGEMRVP